MIKKLRNFIVNPGGQLEKEGRKITADHLIPVVKHQLTKLNWKHLKLTPRTKMSVKRAVTLCSVDVALDILKGPLPPEETVATRTYINQCYKLFKLFNNNLEVDPKCYKELLKILLWFDNWYKETKQESSKATSGLKNHWKKIHTKDHIQRPKEKHQSFPGGSSVCSNASSRITHHSKDHVPG